MANDLPAGPAAPEGEPTTGIRWSPEAIQLAVLSELREQRAAIEALAKNSWLAYAQEIGRSPIPWLGGVRLDVVIVLGLAISFGLVGPGIMQVWPHLPSVSIAAPLAPAPAPTPAPAPVPVPEPR